MSKKIYIDPGHSDVDPGAVGFEIERDLNEKVAKYMHDYLQANYECESKIDPITNNSPKQTALNANAWGADLLVSIHFNAGGGDGYEVLVYSESRADLGKIFEKYVKEIGQNSRGVKIRTNLSVLKYSDMPAVLNEGAFVDNEKDIKDWNDNSELKKLGVAYAKAAAEYLKLPMKTVSKPIKTYGFKLPELSKGMSNNASVKALQIFMVGMGYKVGTTGNFGNGTVSTLKKVQEELGIPATGVCDEKTWAKILGL